MKSMSITTFTVSHILSPAAREDSEDTFSVRKEEKIRYQLLFSVHSLEDRERNGGGTVRGRFVRRQKHKLWIFSGRRSLDCYM